MPSQRSTPRRVKLHRIYSTEELAVCCGVHKNTVRHWQTKGLEPVSKGRPTLFDGATVRAFLAKRNASRKQPCPPGTLYCFKCRQPRAPAMGMVEATRQNATTGNLSAICEVCGTMMHRRTRLAAIAAIMPNLAVQIREAGSRICERTAPSLNCDDRKD
ncbi:helix-turn-helix domain-containing protein [Novosphingobium sp. 9]|uniref:helix-turn-helix domain-containing protein n=1 Tax=Novosphingobium sp. 9 TaxID=2025349 RepID=UPI0021B66674|nr:helix-turn-helix domain-containing protein [Novosphingobium sp. 9]